MSNVLKTPKMHLTLLPSLLLLLSACVAPAHEDPKGDGHTDPEGVHLEGLLQQQQQQQKEEGDNNGSVLSYEDLKRIISNVRTCRVYSL